MGRAVGGSKPFKVEITEEIINGAKVRDSGHCIIANALKASLGGLRPVVDVATIRWTNKEQGIRYIALTPARAQRLLLEWDKGIVPEPFTLRVYPFQMIRSGRKGSVDNTKKVIPGAVRSRRSYSSHAKGKAVQGSGDNIGNPTTIGGTLPPTGALSNIGRRRTFGLRIAER